ncbi:hypothetical protein [Leifsonia aquatica]|uniref:hypothetical protein n=1 Tax=Leifsonia aquatica TaxID=144185 RepID=UPI000468DD4E|nr:hypothetical protein [Leifsonia aquatica]
MILMPSDVNLPPALHRAAAAPLRRELRRAERRSRRTAHARLLRERLDAADAVRSDAERRRFWL